MMEEQPLTLGRIWERGKAFLEEKDVPDAGLDAWYLMEQVWQVERSFFYAHRDDPVDTEEERERLGQYGLFLQRRGRREPLQHILGYAWFMGLRFAVDRRVLIPRQDTEVLVEEAAKRIQAGFRILDMCTGSGCILLSLLYHHPEAEGIGVDISGEALEVASENSRLLDIPAGFVCSDLFERVEGRVQMIISNPPYIPSGEIPSLMEEVRGYDPHLALDGGEDGLDLYRRLIRDGRAYLTPGGVMLLEIGAPQGRWVRAYMEEMGYERVQIIKDLAGLDRVVLGYRSV